jgi:hypothetical protein
MPIGIEKRPVYLNVDKSGHLVMRDAARNIQAFDFIEGELTDCRVVAVDGHYGASEKLQLDFSDDDGTLYRVSMGHRTGHARSIVLALAGVERFGRVKLSVWKKDDDGYIRAAVRNDGELLRWAHPLPPAGVDESGEKDTTTRDEFIDELLRQIQARLPGQVSTPAVPSSLADAIRIRREQALPVTPVIDDDDVPF